MNLPALLEGYVARCNQRAFNWRSNNCCHFAAGWVNLVHGWRPMAGLPDTVDARAARQMLRSLGHDLKSITTERLGTEPMDPLLAATGDIVLLDTSAGIGQALGVVSGMHFFAPSHSLGLVSLPVSQAVCAWRVT